jgi:DNA-binding response OmpR family regulator
MKVLIAEDDPTSRYMLERTLGYWGYETISVCDGAMAMMFLSLEDPPDFVIMDWEMPKIKGTKVCDRMRANPDIKDLYVIMLTSRASKEDMMEGYRSGADDFITKPVSVSELKISVDKAAEITNRKIPLTSRKDIRIENINIYMQRNNLPLI